MKIPTINGVIRRRILLNYRVDPAAIQKELPANFRPKTVNGFAIAKSNHFGQTFWQMVKRIRRIHPTTEQN